MPKVVEEVPRSNGKNKTQNFFADYSRLRVSQRSMMSQRGFGGGSPREKISILSTKNNCFPLEIAISVAF